MKPGTADLTTNQRQAGLGMSHARLFPCGHKGSITGAGYHRGMGMYLRCAACNAARSAPA